MTRCIYPRIVIASWKRKQYWYDSKSAVNSGTTHLRLSLTATSWAVHSEQGAKRPRNEDLRGKADILGFTSALQRRLLIHDLFANLRAVHHKESNIMLT